MTRGAGRTRGHRPSEPRPVVVPFGETTICPACRRHEHGSCRAHTAALGLGGIPGCPCGCHAPLDDPLLTSTAIDDMAAHGTLAAYVKIATAWMLGSGPIHLDEPCRRCAARAVSATEDGP